MAEFHQNLWAPWRMEYIRSLREDLDNGCFLCRYAGNPDADTANHVLKRTATSMVLLNRFPYSNGHLLIAPRAHKAQLAELTADETVDLMRLISDGMSALRTCMHAQGFNIGMNLGHCAGAGLPDHLHWHVVPRWSGDTNYMSVIGDVRVIPDSLEANFRALREQLMQGP